MTPTTLKIKIKMLHEGDTFEGLANKWGFSRALLTKVAHGERGSGDRAKRAQKKLARYMGSTVADLFGEGSSQQRAA